MNFIMQLCRGFFYSKSLWQSLIYFGTLPLKLFGPDVEGNASSHSYALPFVGLTALDDQRGSITGNIFLDTNTIHSYYTGSNTWKLKSTGVDLEPKHAHK